MVQVLSIICLSKARHIVLVPTFCSDTDPFSATQLLLRLSSPPKFNGGLRAEFTWI